MGGLGVFGGVVSGRGCSELGFVRACDANGAAGGIQEAAPGMVLRWCGVWLHTIFFSYLFYFVSLPLLLCLFCVALVGGAALRLSGVLLRVALKHRGSVAAGLRCGLWPSDSVGCGDCGLADSAVRGH